MSKEGKEALLRPFWGTKERARLGQSLPFRGLEEAVILDDIDHATRELHKALLFQSATIHEQRLIRYLARRRGKAWLLPEWQRNMTQTTSHRPQAIRVWIDELGKTQRIPECPMREAVLWYLEDREKA